MQGLSGPSRWSPPQAETLFGKLGTHSQVAGATLWVSRAGGLSGRAALWSLAAGPPCRPGAAVAQLPLGLAVAREGGRPPLALPPVLPCSLPPSPRPSLPRGPPILQLRDIIHSDRFGRQVTVLAEGRRVAAAAISTALFQLCHEYGRRAGLRDSQWYYVKVGAHLDTWLLPWGLS